MTPGQQERIKNKIAKIKAALAADKRRHGGCYDDSRGLRYLPPALYIQLGDYTGRLRYMTWFGKNFKDDRGFPEFLFEWMIILFKTGRLKEAARMATQTYSCNNYVIDKFFGLPLHRKNRPEFWWPETLDYANEHFNYSHHQEGLSDFTEWLEMLSKSEEFLAFRAKFDEDKQRK